MTAYAVADTSWGPEERLAIQRLVEDGRFTMGDAVRGFEEAFAARLGVRHAVMVNSGSSANLMAVAALVHHPSRPLQRGDEVIVPALSWATTYSPLQQYGLKLTAGDLHLIQLRTRRPVLLDGGALDMLAYISEPAPYVDRILREVYGTDLDAVRRARRGTLAPETGRDLWERRTPEEWRGIGLAFGVTSVVTPRAWTLHLPVAAATDTLALYDIRIDATARATVQAAPAR